MKPIENLCSLSSSRHSHLCPRQVLGIRIGLAGAQALGLALPIRDKPVVVFIETDGCFADGVEVATGCTLGHRTLRVEDSGKIAATFVEVKTGKALRIAPGPDVRELACDYKPEEKSRYMAMLEAYKVIPTTELLKFEPVVLKTSIEKIVSLPGVRVNCSRCGEEIINEREVLRDGLALCAACAGEGYYRHP